MKTISFAVIDTETTGLDASVDQLCEIAFRVVSYDLESETVTFLDKWETMVNPGKPIPPEVSSVHHIIDEDVQGAPSPEEAVKAMALRMEELGVDMLVAHNAKFDASFVGPHLGALGQCKPWLCTRRLAKQLWPEAPNHKNQTLRYWLGLQGIDRHGPVHRALFDADVTATLFARMFECGLVTKAYGPSAPELRAGTAVDCANLANALISLSEAPIQVLKMPFGKHRDMLLTEIPSDYLKWALRQPFDDNDLVHSLRAEYQRRCAR